MGKVEIILSGDERRLLTALDKVVVKEAELRRGFAKLDKKQEESFGDTSTNRLAKYALGFVSITTAIELAHRAFDAFEASKREASQQIQSASRTTGQLAQLAGSQGELEGLIANALEVQQLGAYTDRNVANAVTFELQSAGLNTAENRQLAGNLNRVGFDTVPFLQSAGAIRAAFGEEEAGSATDIADKALAAGELFQVFPDQLLAGSARAGGKAATLGISDEEIIAATGVTGAARGSPKEGGSFLNALLRSVIQDKGVAKGVPGIFGGTDTSSISGILGTIEGSGLSNADLVKVLSSEGFDAFKALSLDSSGRNLFGAALSSQNAAQGTNLAAQKVAFQGGIPELAAVQGLNSASAAAEAQGIPLGVEFTEDRRDFTNRITERKRRGGERTGAAIEAILPEVLQNAGADQLVTDKGFSFGPGEAMQRLVDLVAALVDLAESNTEQKPSLSSPNEDL